MNYFTAQALIISRLSALNVGFATVSNPSKIAGLRDLGPLLPACIVMPGEGAIASQQKNNAGVIEEQTWSLVIIVGHQYDDAVDGLTEVIAGELITACIESLSGWALGAGFVGTLSYVGREAPTYGLGYAEFPLNFSIKFLSAI